ncbi:LEVG family PEP-CTERM protein [Anabaena cylindrica UHCC 0172]|uniref:LEVG family PEP-CTERM protein n=1 Tax=Anabaena cylindrica TaxID=1165 RepID=UPI002B203903|nr:LEVG family PEP-CTERM protein [Anabaena cylindrica]MEA5549721.1 LEVG family PEP-CTERM protein [Anabaena cylindrica UHCC 0172]
MTPKTAIKQMTSFKSLVTTVALSTLGLSLFGGVSKAQAAFMVPPIEGEIKLVGTGCVTDATCIDTNAYGYTVESLNIGVTGYGKSLLFSDDSTTANNQNLGAFAINFLGIDAGTNSPEGTWFRPVAVKVNGDGSVASIPENGQLEVGKYKFDFLGETLSKIVLTFFDVEDIGTKISQINGAGANMTIAPGLDGNFQTVTLTNVSSFNVNLGKIGGKMKPGDGVRLQVEVPEPTTILGLGALGMAGAFGLRKGKKASPVA